MRGFELCTLYHIKYQCDNNEVDGMYSGYEVLKKFV
jgi:hypothetical protein